ncbi:YALIA101S04e01442g1_1 [Yarrowia lipolytica]|nr:TPR repeat protein oca3 [Yarrowia lipolytica]SEI33749.1 YALIA101S04e01442g1_1 [Yarrowia lipolytica]
MSLVQSAERAEYLNLNTEQLKQLHEQSTRFLAGRHYNLSDDDRYALFEQHFYLALLVGDSREAEITYQKLADRFGEDTGRIGRLKSMLIDRQLGPKDALMYLQGRPESDLPCWKARIALLRDTGVADLYISELVKYLEVVPTDPEAWSELAEAYAACEKWGDAISAVEEVLLCAPLAYNMFARLGELYLAAGDAGEAISHFCRAVELCPVYIRAWCGILVAISKHKKGNDKLKAVATKQLEKLIKEKKGSEGDIAAAKLILA